MSILKSLLKKSDVLGELLTGILLYGLVCQTVFLFFGSVRTIYHSAGLWTGVILALAGALHMTWSLDRSLDLSADEATKQMRKYSLLRYGVVVIIFGIMMILDIASPLTAFLGILGLKAGAYMQPFVHKAAVKIGISKDAGHETGDDPI